MARAMMEDRWFSVDEIAGSLRTLASSLQAIRCLPQRIQFCSARLHSIRLRGTRTGSATLFRLWTRRRAGRCSFGPSMQTRMWTISASGGHLSKMDTGTTVTSFCFSQTCTNPEANND